MYDGKKNSKELTLKSRILKLRRFYMWRNLYEIETPSFKLSPKGARR